MSSCHFDTQNSQQLPFQELQWGKQISIKTVAVGLPNTDWKAFLVLACFMPAFYCSLWEHWGVWRRCVEDVWRRWWETRIVWCNDVTSCTLEVTPWPHMAPVFSLILAPTAPLSSEKSTECTMVGMPMVGNLAVLDGVVKFSQVFGNISVQSGKA